MFLAFLLFLFLLLLLHFPAPQASPSMADCQRKCGDTDIPYPFGISPGCYLDDTFRVHCNDSAGSLSLPWVHMEIDAISVDTHTFRHRNFRGIITQFQKTGSSYVYHLPPYLITHYRCSHERNTFVAMGCDFFVYLVDEETHKVQGSCSSLCNNNDAGAQLQHNPSSCSGLDCCQINYYADLKNFSVRFQTMNSWPEKMGKHCGLFTFVENEYLDHHDLKLVSCNDSSGMPMIHDWAVGNTNCDKAVTGDGYLCGANSDCVDYATDNRQYRCRCRDGYSGNPYLPQGCKDVDECSNSEENTCPNDYHCVNTPGSYYCLPSHSRILALFIPLGAGLAFGMLCLSFFSVWTWRKLKKVKEQRKKQRFFKRNGGFLLQQRIYSTKGSPLLELNVFRIEELEKATDKFSKTRILGKGGLGTVYKGMLSDGRIVAVKKAHSIDDKQIGHFVNEVFILSQINHRHIVKLLGCCLESEVPLLVYEYIPNGTLSLHIHSTPNNTSKMSWENRLRIAAEIAGALAYLHSCASTAIFHRDVKSNNILLDENYRAVVSDFGLSRSVSIDKTHLTTIVGGTFGYLDPQYFRSGHLNDKSDVYAFGVVLAEILTGQPPVSATSEEDGLACRFRAAMKSDYLLEMVEKALLQEVEVEVDEIVAVAKLAKRCLKINARKRPSMKEVTAELEQLRRKNEVPCGDDQPSLLHDQDYRIGIEEFLHVNFAVGGDEETASLISSFEVSSNKPSSRASSY